MIDIVWPTKITLFNELMYSINSARMNFLDLGRCWVLSSSNPNLNAKWIKADDTGEHTDQTLIHKLMLACELDCISDPFIYCCDDMYFLRPSTEDMFSEIVAHSSPVIKVPQNHGWKNRLHRTLEKLNRLGFSCYNYSTHIPYVIHKSKFLNSVSIMGTDNQLCSMYFNTNHSQPNCFLGDTNLRAGFYSSNPYSVIQNKCSNSFILNHDDSGLNEDMKRYIQENFGV